MQFGVDHLGHWTLTAPLLPALLHTPDPRRDRDEDRAPSRPGRGPENPTSRAIRAVARLRPGQAGEPPLRTRAAARTLEGRGADPADRPPRFVQHRLANRQRRGFRRPRLPAVLPHSCAANGDVCRQRSSPAASCRDRTVSQRASSTDRCWSTPGARRAADLPETRDETSISALWECPRSKPGSRQSTTVGT